MSIRGRAPSIFDRVIPVSREHLHRVMTNTSGSVELPLGVTLDENHAVACEKHLLAYDLAALTAIINHAEMMSPGIGSRINAVDITALFNSFARVFRDCYSQGDQALDGASIPKLHITPPASYLEILVKGIPSGLLPGQRPARVAAGKPAASRKGSKMGRGEKSKTSAKSKTGHADKPRQKHKSGSSETATRGSTAPRDAKASPASGSVAQTTATPSTVDDELLLLQRAAYKAAKRAYRSRTIGSLLKGKGKTLEDVRDAIGKITDVELLRSRSTSGRPVLYHLGLITDDDVKGDWYELDTLGRAEEKAEKASASAVDRARQQLSKAIQGETKRCYRYVPVGQSFLSQLKLRPLEAGASVHDSFMVMISMLRSNFTKSQSRVPRDLKDAQLSWDVFKHRTIQRDGRFCYQISVGCDDPDLWVRFFAVFNDEQIPTLYSEKPDAEKFGVPISVKVQSGSVSVEEVKRQEPLPPRRRKSRASRPGDLGPST